MKRNMTLAGNLTVLMILGILIIVLLFQETNYLLLSVFAVLFVLQAFVLILKIREHREFRDFGDRHRL